MGGQEAGMFKMNTVLIVFGSILLVLGFIIFLMRSRKG